jgi:hypothetical protein
METSLQFCKAQGGQQHLTIVLRQFVENGISTIASMNTDIRIDQVGHVSAKPSLPFAQRHLDRHSRFDAGWLRHAAQDGYCVTQAVPGWKNGDDIAKTRDFQVHIRIGIGEIRRDANGLTVT